MEITIAEGFIFLILCVIIGVLIYGIRNLIIRTELLEEENNRLQIKIEYVHRQNIDAYDKIKAADIRGSFEADDEVGGAFKDIQEAISYLNNQY